MVRKAGGLVVVLAGLVGLLMLAGCGGSGASKVPVIGVMQFTSNEVQDPAREGFVKALNDAGYRDGSTARFIFKNAQGDLPTMQLIAQYLNQQADLIFVVSTQALQAALGVVKQKPVIFAAVADPKTAGAGESAEDHLPNVAGAPSTAPMREALQIVREALPQARQLGLLYDPASANSLFYLEYLEQARAGLDFTLVPMTVHGSGDVLQAAQALAAKGIDAFFVISDPFVLQSFDSLVKVAQAQHIPVFTTVPNLVSQGAAVAVGWNYFDNGYLGGQIAVRVLKGEKPGAIPFQWPTKFELHVNPAAAEAQGWRIPQAMIDRAQRVIGR
jgi:putative ABC transport system substrate-binding protein